MNSITSFGYWVRRRRKTLDLTQIELAQHVGCSVVTIRKIERDERRPSRQIAELLADHLDIANSERDNFVRMARGQFVVEMPSPLKIHAFPDFLQADDELPQPEDTPFAAREFELAQLDTFMRETLSGRGCVAFVTGGPGRGKTVLVQEFARRAEKMHTHLIVAGGSCNAHTGVGDPYLPFREILELLTGDIEARWAAGSIDREYGLRLWNLVPYSLQTLVENGPDLIDIFVSGPPLLARAEKITGDDSAWLSQLKQIVTRNESGLGPAKVEQRALIEQYARVLKALARQRPIVLVLDDLQWADVGSINLLFHLGRRLEGNHLLIIGIYRPTDVALGRDGERHPLEPVINEFHRQFGQNKIDLNQTDNRHFVEAYLNSEPNRFGTPFREALYKHARGHALFTVEMVRGMQERGGIIKDEYGLWIEETGLNWESLPARVEGIIEERISRLPASLQTLLQVASVEGEVFTAEVLAQVQGIDESDTVWQLSRTLGRQHRLVRAMSSRRLGLEGQRLSRYRFRHILFQKYLYSRMDEAERGYHHEAVGTVLEQIYEDRTEEVAVQLAHHFQTAGLTLKAIDYLRQAGDRAVRLSANEEALTHFFKGLALLSTMPQATEHLRQELAIQIALFAPLVAAKGYAAPEVGQAYTRARILGEQVGDPKQVFWVTHGLWGHNLSSAQMEPARELAERSLVLARQIQEPAQLMEAYRMLNETHFHRGELVAARKYLEMGLPLYDPQHHRAHAEIHGQDPGVAYLSHGSWILWHLGFPDQALKMGREAVISGEESSHPFSLGYALCYTAVLHQLLNNRHYKD